MAVKITVFSILTSMILLTGFSIYFYPHIFHQFHVSYENLLCNFSMEGEEDDRKYHVSKPTDSILLPDWEVLVISSLERSESGEQYYCLFPNNVTSSARFTGTLALSYRATFKCNLPKKIHHLLQYPQPLLIKSPGIQPESMLTWVDMYRWDLLAYESLSTEGDVILFVKGINNIHGNDSFPAEFSCLFSTHNNDYYVKTLVTSSSQEVFRCLHPDEAAIRRLVSNGDEKIKVSIGNESLVVPTVANYVVPGGVADVEKKSLLCACTMVHNVGKYLKEWVMYNAKLGVEKFILYDNDSEDDLQKVIEELGEQQYDLKTIFWPWPKTQEAGFSHCAIQAREKCTWMMYMDVDEFVFSPSWLNAQSPSHNMIASLLPNTSSSAFESRPIGQVSIRCLEFGPSNQSSHPVAGVTQGYICRRKRENRRKSLVLLDAVEMSLHNVIHYFKVKKEYGEKTLTLYEGVVNHYKYQAWSEFKVKFKRRVSTYVVDWTKEENASSNDRTPGLGFKAIEPEGWPNKFCEVQDDRLKMVTRRWFGLNDSNGYKMAWEG